jgi:hypothetical protein
MPADPALVERLSQLEASGMAPEAAQIAEAVAVAFDTSVSSAQLAVAIRSAFPDVPARTVALLVITGRSDTDESEMYDALTGCGFTEIEARGAVNLLYPATMSVEAGRSWQTTGIVVTGQQTTSIDCGEGLWTANPDTGMCGPAGNARYLAKPGYTLPGAPEGAMVGRIGSNPPFLVGTGATAPAGQAGLLSLCINDDLQRRYGVGLSDNAGSIPVTVTTS